MKILVTCPPMLGMLTHFAGIFAEFGVEVTAPKVVQTLSVDDLMKLVPEHDGWIIGDDPANDNVFSAGKAGKLKAAVKWGVGVDNVDFEACNRLGIKVANTPNMFGNEVADVAIGYVIALARETYVIHEGVRQGLWPKPRGISLSGRTVALIGYGDIGKNAAQRLLAFGMKVIVYDPGQINVVESNSIRREIWPNCIDEADFIVITCALTQSSFHMINAEVLAQAKRGTRIVNVGRGPVIHEEALENALRSGQVYSAALDVFEVEPLPLNSFLREHPRCVFGSHNSSNTIDAVIKTSELAINKLMGFLGE
ncbi:phosphoglycerate dehydrogenase [Pseudohongiella sp. SYSU M77423]|uniref:phosphoglycerate dehydrogenase n=1 Tax=Pseudohongiella sp. SYSU M77423 TaxID=3042312 RepID=UPI00247FDEBC|nr:phosphoglycerate dehydrogenase [Pseudohongiella sp. SYSU M77423]MDH7944937.1 phosphoglycerate dehydrogenase [Pseudohongiella sp. SYSU M77423]